MIDNNTVKIITQTITPQETEYVAGISNILSDLNDNKEVSCECCDDVIYVAKIMAFCDKFKTLHWGASNMSYHKALDEFTEIIETYKDEIAENIQSIVGQFVSSQFTKLELPISNNPLEVINELKICVNNWLEAHSDNIEYEGCRNATSGFLQDVHKYVYLFRLCKNQ